MTESKLPRTFTAEELGTKEIPEIKVLIPGLLQEGLTILAGSPKVGKSFLCHDLGISISSGSNALGCIDTNQSGVLYISMEDGERRLQDRMFALLQGMHYPKLMHYSIEWPEMNRHGFHQLEDWLDAHPEVNLVIFDTLARIRPGAK